MNETDTNEQLSAFVDGEIPGPECARVVEALYESPKLRRTWARYHLIGDALRAAGTVPDSGTIGDRVSRPMPDERVVQMRPRTPRRARVPLRELALAASVAAVAILGVGNLHDGGERHTVPVAQFARHAPETAQSAWQFADEEASQVAAATPEPVTRAAAGRAQGDAEARINAYLANHSEFGGHGLGGLLPYVRVVGYHPDAGDFR